MSKILILIFFFFLPLINTETFSYEDLTIISREEWGALESYRYLNGPEWQDIIEKRKNDETTLTQSEKEKNLKEQRKNKIANNFLVNQFTDIFSIESTQKNEGDYILAWPISKTNSKQSIVIHHTDSNYDNSLDAIKKIYKYHALNKKWGDIGYNYLIGIKGEIFEGRAGGDNTVAGHDKWNNYSSIGIAIIGNYDSNKLNSLQEESLKKLVKNLVRKYNINLSKKTPFFKRCIGDNNCDQKPIIVTYDYPIIGHRDAGHTNCPGDALYKYLLKLRTNLISEYDPLNDEIKSIITTKLKKVDENKLINILAVIEEKMDTTNNRNNFLIYNSIKNIIFNIENEKAVFFSSNNNQSFDDNNKIKVKLSYPIKDNISIEIKGKYNSNIEKNKSEFILDFLPGEKTKNYKINLYLKDDKLFINNTELIGFSENNFFRIKSPGNSYLTISSWERKPTWDTSGTYNDNKFKGDIVIYKKNNQLVVVNELYLTDYLKGLGEVSNSTNKEKVRSIIVLARTYARWYMTKAEKFAGEWYQASDDPNVFQKYLGYSLELRSPNINKIVSETKDIVVTYGGNIIKPWYFSSSDGYTRDFLEYCDKATGVPDCENPENFPFLSKVKDFGGYGKTRNGHGVGVPGTGIEYFSARGWNYPLIIKYFLKGVQINKI